ncbi:hypothetical protein BgiBS90_018845, partial [Biomphalaria glabrata]
TLQVYSEEVELLSFHCTPFYSKSMDVYIIMNIKDNLILACFSNSCSSPIGAVATFNESGSYFSFVLSSITMRRLIRGIKCVFINETNSRYNYSEDIAIIAKAQGLSCLDAEFVNNSTDISITCMTLKVYPEALCTFEVSNK